LHAALVRPTVIDRRYRKFTLPTIKDRVVCFAP
jgi:hypothetical protein